jgi:hypothetical protein
MMRDIEPERCGQEYAVNLILWDHESGEVQLGSRSVRGRAQKDVRALVPLES